MERRRLSEAGALVFNDMVSPEQVKSELEENDDDPPGYMPSGPSFSELCAMSNIQTQKWFDDWQSMMGWWWQVQPWRNWKNACYLALFNMGVFGLARAFKRYRAVQFLNKIDELFPPMPPSPPKDGGDKEQCETVGEGAAKTKIEDIELPEMPNFPKEFRLPPIIPIPRLLPRWELVQAHNDAMMALEKRLDAEEAIASGTFADRAPIPLALDPTTHATTANDMWMAGLGGFSIGCAVLIGASAYKLTRGGRKQRVAMRTRATSPHPAQIGRHRQNPVGSTIMSS